MSLRCGIYIMHEAWDANRSKINENLKRGMQGEAQAIRKKICQQQCGRSETDGHIRTLKQWHSLSQDWLFVSETNVFFFFYNCQVCCCMFKRHVLGTSAFTLCCQYVRKWGSHVASCFMGVLFDMTVRERGRLQRKGRMRESRSNGRSLVLNPIVRGKMAKERAVIKPWLRLGVVFQYPLGSMQTSHVASVTDAL